MAPESAAVSPGERTATATTGWQRHATAVGIVITAANLAMKVAIDFSVAQFLILVPWLVVLAMPFAFHATRLAVVGDHKLRTRLIIYTVLTITSAAVPLLADRLRCGPEECTWGITAWKEAPFLVRHAGAITIASSFGALIALWGVLARHAR